MTNNDLLIYASAAATLLGAIFILSQAGLKGWNGWLTLKRAELDHLAARSVQAGADYQPLSTSTRIEVADLKERIRKLEAIAAGVDL
jgi:hypothetical protein